jgi:hypothetical protein
VRVHKPHEFNYHIFLYGVSGHGKTQATASFPGLVMVSPFKHSDATLDEGVPFINPETEEELRAVIEAPDLVIERYIKPVFPDYEVRTFCFDILRDLQALCLGHERIPAVKDGDRIIVPERAPHGAMARPGNRNAKTVGNELDYRIVDSHMRAILAIIDDMPFHTILTAHADQVGRKKGDDDSEWQRYYPAVEGWALKRDLPGIVGDFCLALEKRGDRFLCHPETTKDYFARNRWRKRGLTKTFDWTDKSFYEILEDYRGKKIQQQKQV